MKDVRAMVVERFEDKVIKARNTLYYYNIKEVKKAVKATERIAIDRRKAVAKAKREAKELNKSERVAYLILLIG